MLVSNRAARRASLKTAKTRKDWTWYQRVHGPVVAYGRPMPSWVNDFYSVQVYARATEWGEVLHCVLRRHDAKPDIPWSHKQRIKDELFGMETTAIEIFPPRSELVDEANCYHMWVLPRALPFGLPRSV